MNNLLQRLRIHLLQMSPEQKAGSTGKLMIELVEVIAELEKDEPTKGTLWAAENRAICNSLTDEQRRELTLRAIQMVDPDNPPPAPPS